MLSKRPVAFLLLFAWCCTISVGAFAQAAGGSEVSRPRPRVSLGANPFSLYSATYGPGLDGHLTVHHLPIPDSRIRLHAWPSLHRRLLYMTASVPEPTGRRVFLSGYAFAEWNRNDIFYGTGARSHRDDRVLFDRDGISAEARLGVQTANGRLLAQPLVRYERHELRDARDDDDAPGAFDRLITQPRNQARIPSFDRPESGLFFGLDLSLDLRDRRAAPGRGAMVFGRVERYRSSTDSKLRFDRLTIGGSLILPAPDLHKLVARVLATSTRETGDAAAPYFYLPVLDHRLLPGYGRNRLADLDRLVANVEYRMPVLQLFDLYQVDLLLHAGVGNVFSDLSDEFSPAVTFDRSPPETGERLPLRPAAGVGVMVASLANERVLLHWILGLGAGGVTVVPVRFVFSPDLRNPAPTFR